MSVSHQESFIQGSPGVVFTRPWVVSLMLDLAGYVDTKPLASLVAVEPSAGDGAFLREMIRRLVSSARKHAELLEDLGPALRAYEIDPKSAKLAQSAAEETLVQLNVPAKVARRLAAEWIVCGDFLEQSLGFPVADFVIGNPPYIRLEELAPKKNLFYRSSFPAMKGRADIYVAFYQAALMQLKSGGVCAYICADRWLLNDYGEELRKFITKEFAVRHIVDAHDVQAFESEVSAYPAITVLAKDEQGAVYVCKGFPGLESRPAEEILAQIESQVSSSTLSVSRFDTWFVGKSPWTCASPEVAGVLADLERRFAPLESEDTGTKVGIGVATGADRVFITKTPPKVEASRLLPLAMGSDLEQAEVNWSGYYLINPWTKDGLVDLGKFPKLGSYFEEHGEILRARHTAKKAGGGWHKTIDRVNMDLFEQSKLYIPDIKDHLCPSLDTGKTYPHHNVYWITSKVWDLEVLGGLLISDVAEFFVRSYGVKMRGGYFRFQAQYLRRIRIPAPSEIGISDTRKLKEAFRSRNRILATEVALKLYGLDSLPDRRPLEEVPASGSVLLGYAKQAAG